MARQTKNNADYFSHDSDMRNNPRVKALRAKHGLEGYAVWCMILETLTNAHDFTLKCDELMVEILAGDFGTDPDVLNSILKSCGRLQLLEWTEHTLKCPSLIERMKPLEAKRQRKRAWMEQMRGNEKGKNRDVDVQNPVKDGHGTSTTHKDKDKDKGKGKDKDRDDDVVKPTPPPPPFDESEILKNLSSMPGVIGLLSSPEEGSLSLEKIEKFRAAFEREMAATNKQHENESDLVKHFIFWVRKKSKGGGAANGVPAPSAGVVRRGGLNDIRMTEEDYNRPQYF